ncbi:MAG: hypothetical protein ACFFED_00700 [Candidatus Thorarchaeota archaeon]
MQLDFALLLGSLGLIIVLVVVIGIIINALFLGIALGFVNGENRELGTTFVTALLSAIVTVIPCLGCILAWYFIKTRHELGWGGAIAAWILTFIIEAIVLFAIVFLAFPGLLAILML